MIEMVLVDWPHLADDEKVKKTEKFQDRAQECALVYCYRLSDVVKVESSPDIKYWTSLRQLAGDALLLQANIVIQAASAEERRLAIALSLEA